MGIVDFEFSPPALHVAPGTTVRFTNLGVAPHTATAKDGSFDSGMLEAGGTWTHRFDAVGTQMARELLCEQRRVIDAVAERLADDAGWDDLWQGAGG